MPIPPEIFGMMSGNANASGNLAGLLPQKSQEMPLPSFDEIKQEAERIRLSKPTRAVNTPIPIEWEKKKREDTINDAMEMVKAMGGGEVGGR